MLVESCETSKREGQVNQEISKAENSADRLVARIDEMEKQLFEVLHGVEPPSPTLNKEEPEAAVPLVPLASRIRDHYKLLQNLGTRITELSERLEIR